MLKWFADRLAETGKDARKDERGFTLIELLVVVIIIGILAAIAIPTFLNQRDGAQDADAVSAARNAATAIQSESTAQGGEYGFADGWDETDLEDIESSLGSYDISVTGDADSFEVSVASEAGGNAVFNSTSGEVTPPA